MANLKEMLETLRMGEGVVLQTTITQHGKEIPCTTLAFENGEYTVWELCSNCADYDLGTCNCVSHNPWTPEVISRREALYWIKRRIEQEQAEQGNRRLEMAWLDKAISSF